MKKRIIVITVILCMVVGFLYLQYGRDVKVISTMNTASGNCYEMDLTVAANRLFIMDQEKFAEDLGVTRVTISNLERGKVKITKTYKLAIKYLVDNGYYDIPNERIKLINEMLQDL